MTDISSSAATSRRGYLSRDELEQFADITISDDTEADDQINQAEELIDQYVGFQNKFLKETIKGRCAQAGAATTLYLQATQQNLYQNDYFKGCEVEIIGGTGAGQRRRITASDCATGALTVASAWTTNPDTTSFYRVYQLGKFPRQEDVDYYTETTPYVYYKQIPEAVKRAVAAQVDYMIQMGDKFFSSDKSQKESERISAYSYTMAKGSGNLEKLIAPKARLLLRAVRNRVGEIA